MPYHTGEKKKPMNKKPTKKPTKKPLRKLTANELKALDKMKEKHTTKHINKMKLLIREGKTFRQAHAIAMKMVGK
tara:strand:- start:75 stop:299 length:225 start_codon:yes stop_codon:yes gene_type:complete